jgi:hypothetical protein
MLAAPILINRSMTNYWAGVSGKGDRINPRCRTTIKREMDIYHHGPGPMPIICQLPGPPVSHWSLPLRPNPAYVVMGIENRSSTV